jgi:signal transduction histidine kinase
VSSFREVLADLSQLDKSDFHGALKQLLRVDGLTLGIARVSYWTLDREKTTLTCDLLAVREPPSFERGTQLSAAAFPRYFEALRECRSIVAHDVSVDTRTLEFLEAYFRPLGITSMLDIPVWHAGKLCGVLCHEHVGEPRHWTANEQDFAGSVADMIATALEARGRSRAEERFQLLALATGDVAWEMDVLAHTVDWSEGASEGLRFPTGSLGTTADWWISQIHADDREEIKASINAAIAAGINWTAEYRFRLGDGTIATFADRGFIVRDSEGNPTRMVGAMENITEQRHLKAKLQISDRMASVGTLAAGVAHEINNPLASIQSNLEFAINELKSGVTSLDEVFEVLNDAQEGVERVRVIVRDLKHFSRVDDAVAQAVALEPLIDSTLSMAWNEVRHRAMLVKDFQPTPLVVAHEAKLGQVVLNLIVNAAQAIKEGAREKNRIWVRTFTDRHGWATIEVEDTGPGVPAELRTRVFDPFFTTKPLGVGTGLGLSICHGLVSGMNGEILLLDGAQGGCLVRVRLPPAAVAIAPTAPPVTLGGLPTGVTPRVLVVDDEVLVAKAACRTLQRDHDVQWVGSGRAALDLLDAGARFDVMLCDVMMPEMTGIDLFVELKRRADPIAKQFIFVTGGAFSPDTQRFLEASGVLSLEKPYRQEDLRRAILSKLVTAAAA